MGAAIQAIVTDIEGTTSSLSFVKDVLFPYAYKNMADFVFDFEKEVENLLNEVRTEENNPDLTTGEVVEVLLRYMDEDKKITPLKTLQGMIWAGGYESGELQGHIYEDAAQALKAWKKAGLGLYIYSSGSIAAQKLLFGNTEHGDLTPLFSGYFDTTTGAKKDSHSYEVIAEEIGLAPSEILFLSDSIDEINAASAAGMNVVILNRGGESMSALGHHVARDFNDVLDSKV